MKNPQSLSQPRWIQYIGPGLCLVSLLAFIGALPQDLVWGDSPELAASAWILGIPHPTGYSLYMLTLRLFQCLPFGTIVFRGHLFSAICMALASGILYLFLRSILTIRFGERPSLTVVPSLIASLACVLTPVVWSQAIITEVYAFFALLFVLNLWLLLQTLRDPQRFMAPFFFIIGLQLIHHRLAVFVIAASLILLIIRLLFKKSARLFQLPESPVVSLSHTIKSALWILPPISFLLYFPIRAATHPVINWYDPVTFKRWYQLVGADLYKDTLSQSWNGFVLSYQMHGIGYVLRGFLYIFSLPFLNYGLLALLILWGFIALFRTIPWLGMLSLILFSAHQIFIRFYPVGDWETFLLLPGTIVLSIPLAMGIAETVSYLQTGVEKPSVYRLSIIVLCFSALLPINIRFDGENGVLDDPWAISNFALGNGELSCRFMPVSETAPTDYASRVWPLVPDGALLITGLYEETADNELNPLLYQQTVEGRGTSTTIVGAGFLFLDWYRAQVSETLPIALAPRGDRRNRDREEWLTETWDTLIEPCSKSIPILTTSSYLPKDWYSRRTLVEQIPIDTSRVSVRYVRFVPEGRVYRFLSPASVKSENTQ